MAKTRVYKNGTELLSEILNEIKKTKKPVQIATFGMYVDITHDKDWGLEYEPRLGRQILNEIIEHNIPHQILLGMYSKRECVEGCKHCKQKNEENIKRNNNIKAFLGVNMRFNNEMHLKYYRVGNRVWTGGINFGQSDWADVALEIENEEVKKEIYNIFMETWRKSEEVAE